MAALEAPAGALVVLAHEIERCFGIKLDLTLLADAGEDLEELVARRIGDFDLVADAAEECFVPQFGGPQVRREDEEHVERYFECIAAVQGEVVDALFHRHDPAVEQLFGLDHLAAKVIDDQDAAVRLPLQRSDIELRLRRVPQLEFLQG